MCWYMHQRFFTPPSPSLTFRTICSCKAKQIEIGWSGCKVKKESFLWSWHQYLINRGVSNVRKKSSEQPVLLSEKLTKPPFFHVQRVQKKVTTILDHWQWHWLKHNSFGEAIWRWWTRCNGDSDDDDMVVLYFGHLKVEK